MKIEIWKIIKEVCFLEHRKAHKYRDRAAETTKMIAVREFWKFLKRELTVCMQVWPGYMSLFGELA